MFEVGNAFLEGRKRFVIFHVTNVMTEECRIPVTRPGKKHFLNSAPTANTRKEYEPEGIGSHGAYRDRRIERVLIERF